MANTYDVPDLVTLTSTFTDANGTAADPDAALIIVRKADGSLLGYGTSTGWSDQGNWDASANSPALADGTGTAGNYYTVTAAGTVDFGAGDIEFVVNDRVFYNGYFWRRWPSPSSTTLTKSDTGIYYVDHPVGGADGLERVDYRGESVGTNKISASRDHFWIREQEVG